MIPVYPRWTIVCIGAVLVWLVLSGVAPSHIVAQEPQLAPTPVSVQPTAETDPVHHKGDAADDPAIWIHPSDPSLSTIIGTDKQGGLMVYDLAGKELQDVNKAAPQRMNNVDLRYNFPLHGERVALVVASNQSTLGISIYRVNPATRMLEDVAAGVIKAGMQVYGTCMYHSPKTGKYYAFMTRNPYPQDSPKDNNGEVRQYELFENNGKVDARLVRSFIVGSDSEGCVADDELGTFYIAQTKVGIWQYGAEPEDGNARVSIAAIGDGQLQGELEGVSLYYTSHKTGYLIVSQQCCSSYAVYRREGNHAYVMSFRVTSNPAAGVDNVSGTDGLDVTNAPLGNAFPQGLFVVHDTLNDPGGSTFSNFKLVGWQTLANAASPSLAIDTAWDPRSVGAPASSGSTATPTVTQTPKISPTVTQTSEASPTITQTPEASPEVSPTITQTPETTTLPEPTPTEQTSDPGINKNYTIWLPVVSS